MSTTMMRVTTACLLAAVAGATRLEIEEQDFTEADFSSSVLLATLLIGFALMYASLSATVPKDAHKQQALVIIGSSLMLCFFKQRHAFGSSLLLSTLLVGFSMMYSSLTAEEEQDFSSVILATLVVGSSLMLTPTLIVGFALMYTNLTQEEKEQEAPEEEEEEEAVVAERPVESSWAAASSKDNESALSPSTVIRYNEEFFASIAPERPSLDRQDSPDFDRPDDRPDFDRQDSPDSVSDLTSLYKINHPELTQQQKA